MAIDIKLRDYELFVLLINRVCANNKCESISKKILKQFTILMISYDYSLPQTDETISIDLTQEGLSQIMSLTENNSYYDHVYSLLSPYANSLNIV